jgi:MoxR-like ATPase
MRKAFQFRGDLQIRCDNPHPDSPKKPEAYMCAQNVVEAVNLALYLQRPLLLEGEPGCGKTMLTYALAYELGLPLYKWQVNSRSRIREGFYTSVTAAKSQAEPKITLGSVGKAYAVEDRPAVLLIDEVDRAYDEFPTDLLTVLQSPWSFTISETSQEVSASHPPIVVMTNNQTKDNLKESFLRTCVYLYIKFPDEDHLINIVKAVNTEELPDDFVRAAVSRFLEMRSRSGNQQKPGIGELIDWVDVLWHNFGQSPYTAEDLRHMDLVPYYSLLLNAVGLECPDTRRLQQPNARAVLRRKICEVFDLSELATLCFDLGINSFDSIAGQTLESKTRELIAYFERRGRVSDLFGYLRESRENVNWEDLGPTSTTADGQ